jgi:hypothetical protein
LVLLIKRGFEGLGQLGWLLPSGQQPKHLAGVRGFCSEDEWLVLLCHKVFSLVPMNLMTASETGQVLEHVPCSHELQGGDRGRDVALGPHRERPAA